MSALPLLIDRGSKMGCDLSITKLNNLLGDIRSSRQDQEHMIILV